MTNVIHIKIPPETVEVYNKDGIFASAVNQCEFNAIRLQIKKYGEEGWYVVSNEGKRYDIDKNGMVEDWHSGMFNLLDYQLAQLYDCIV